MKILEPLTELKELSTFDKTMLDCLWTKNTDDFGKRIKKKDGEEVKAKPKETKTVIEPE